MPHCRLTRTLISQLWQLVGRRAVTFLQAIHRVVAASAYIYAMLTHCRLCAHPPSCPSPAPCKKWPSSGLGQRPRPLSSPSNALPGLQEVVVGAVGLAGVSAALFIGLRSEPAPCTACGGLGGMTCIICEGSGKKARSRTKEPRRWRDGVAGNGFPLSFSPTSPSSLAGFGSDSRGGHRSPLPASQFLGCFFLCSRPSVPP